MTPEPLEPPPEEVAARHRPFRPVTVLSFVACGLGLLYASYRGYYALGGTAGMFGVPESQAQWAFLNGFAASVLLVAAAVPIVALPLWNRRVARPILLTLFTVAAVGLVMHGLVDETQRILHLAGLAERFHIQIRVVGFRSTDMRVSDLQDILLNEPWFLAEGVVAGSLVWLVLRGRTARTWWGGGRGVRHGHMRRVRAAQRRGGRRPRDRVLSPAVTMEPRLRR